MSTSYKFHPELLNHTGDELRAMAAECGRRSQESFDRCDTDGFLSQWASDITARLYRVAADAADNGWMSEFDALFDIETGENLNARLVDTKYGTSWVYDRDGRSVWVGRSHASTDAKQAKHYAKHGVTLGTVARRVVPAMAGSGSGLSGSAWPTVMIDRDFDDVVVVTTNSLVEEVAS